MLKPNCETIGKSHEYQVISVYPVKPIDLEFMITTMPRDAFESYSTVTYQCRECSDTMIKDMPTEEAEIEEENSEKGKAGTTGM